MLWTLFILFGILVVVAKLYKKGKERELYWQWDNGADNKSEVRERIDCDDLSFPPNFLWGCATAAYQIEGGFSAESDSWARWETQKDSKGEPRIKNGQKAGVACDHWNLYEEDLKLVKELGCNSYRFSVAWSKIEPQEGKYDGAVIQHYHDEIKHMLELELVPMLTLHHFSEPLWFHDRGGFEKEENIVYFVNFAKKMFAEFGKYVPFWCTINEPEVFVSFGWFNNDAFPPGKKDPSLAGVVLKNLLVAHTRVYTAIKSMPGGEKAQIGIVKDIFQMDPCNVLNPLDHVVAKILDKVFNESIIEFLRSGKFHFAMPGAKSLEYHDPKAPTLQDFVGLNYYSHFLVKFVPNLAQAFKFTHPPHALMTDMPHTVYPEGLYRGLKTMATIGKPIYVTENGIADAVDDRRHLYLRRYLYALSKAIQDGVDVRGYFYWSLIDNFEWAEGYHMKFGLYSVDFRTQERKLRDGSKYFQTVATRFAKKPQF